MDLREIHLIDIGIIVNNLELIATFDRLNIIKWQNATLIESRDKDDLETD
jgi:hypothetical protein